MNRFEKALRKAVLGPLLQSIEPPKAPSLKQLVQGPLGVGGAPHGSPHGMWGALFGPMTPEAQMRVLEDELIHLLLR